MRATERLWVGSPTLQKASPAGYFICLYFLEAVSRSFKMNCTGKWEQELLPLMDSCITVKSSDLVRRAEGAWGVNLGNSRQLLESLTNVTCLLACDITLIFLFP